MKVVNDQHLILDFDKDDRRRAEGRRPVSDIAVYRPKLPYSSTRGLAAAKRRQ
jgi:hypothetical protein